MSNLIEKFTALHRSRIAAAHRGLHHSSSTKSKISSSMAGSSNFAGKKHTDDSKEKIQDAGGHDDRVQGRKWRVRRDGKTSRVYKLGATSDYKWGRFNEMKTFEQFVEQQMKGKDPCWTGYHMVGTKNKGGKVVPNCVPTK